MKRFVSAGLVLMFLGVAQPAPAQQAVPSPQAAPPQQAQPGQNPASPAGPQQVQPRTQPQAQPQPQHARPRVASPLLNENADINQGPPPVPFMTWMYDLVFKVRRPDDPSYTLRAPFIRPRDLKTPTATAMGLPYGEDVDADQEAGNLSVAHRSEDQVGGWLIGRASDILDVSGDNWDDHIKIISSLLTKAALDDYMNWMNTSGLLGRLSANHLHMHAYVDDVPLLLNQGAVDGRYRWLYEVHATLSFLYNGSHDYDNPDNQTIATKNLKITIRMQIGRVAEIEAANDEEDDDPAHHITISKIGVQPQDNSEGLTLESWDVRHSDYQ